MGGGGAAMSSNNGGGSGVRVGSCAMRDLFLSGGEVKGRLGAGMKGKSRECNLN